MSYEQILKQMGYAIEPVVLDTGKFMQAVRTGNLIYTSGQVSSWDGKAVKGKIGGDLTIEQGIEAARFCALNNLRAIRTICGSLDNIVQFIKVLGMVNVAPGLTILRGSSMVAAIYCVGSLARPGSTAEVPSA
jgi:enamine deaminase RidA (YjgF/YER057c/UK114 family)